MEVSGGSVLFGFTQGNDLKSSTTAVTFTLDWHVKQTHMKVVMMYLTVIDDESTHEWFLSAAIKPFREC